MPFQTNFCQNSVQVPFLYNSPGVKRTLIGDLYKNTEWDFFADIVSRDPLGQSERGCQFCTPGQMAVFSDFFAKMANLKKNRKNHDLVIKLASLDRKYTTFVWKYHFQLISGNSWLSMAKYG